MKTANSALIAILAGPPQFFYADLWTFALRNGVTKYYTDWATDLTVGGHTFNSSAVLMTGGKYKLQRGLQVDENDLTCYPSATETINGIPFVQAVRNGLMDRAVVTRQRQFMATPGDLTANAPIVFMGEVTDTSPTRNSAVLKLKSMINLLNIYMPRRQYQPTCTWVFGDSNCTVDRTALTVNSTALAGTDEKLINCALSDAAGTYNNGVVTYTSGVNIGLKRSVKSYVPGVVTLNVPFPNEPSVGDTFSIVPGCNKTLSGPSDAFNGAAAAGSTQTTIFSGLSNAAGYFNGGTLQFTSGVNVGQIRTVGLWIPGQANLSSAFPNAPALDDSFTITSVSTNTIGTCTGYNNTANFGGFPYVPVPETAI